MSNTHDISAFPPVAYIYASRISPQYLATLTETAKNNIQAASALEQAKSATLEGRSYGM
jgi:hypothetical protein